MALRWHYALLRRVFGFVLLWNWPISIVHCWRPRDIIPQTTVDRATLRHTRSPEIVSMRHTKPILDNFPKVYSYTFLWHRTYLLAASSATYRFPFYITDLWLFECIYTSPLFCQKRRPICFRVITSVTRFHLKMQLLIKTNLVNATNDALKCYRKLGFRAKFDRVLKT